ncbi:hypothetical protein [Mycobacterium riyadhense]|nr:hypothetical protein [Mycobacterium riyadhense]
MAAIAAVMRLLRLTDKENSAPWATQVVIIFFVPNIESPRTMIVASELIARAVVMHTKQLATVTPASPGGVQAIALDPGDLHGSERRAAT